MVQRKAAKTEKDRVAALQDETGTSKDSSFSTEYGWERCDRSLENHDGSDKMELLQNTAIL